MEHKNIDRLFQEKLKNLEATPSTRVWNGIEAKLTKKKRRVLPMWWFSGGIAAILILGFFIFPFSETTLNNINNQPVIIATPEVNIEKNNTTKQDPFLKENEEKTVIVEESKIVKKKPVFQNKNNEKSTILVAEKTSKNIKKENRSSVSKIAMEKIFLTETALLDSIKNKTLLAQENVLENLEKKESNAVTATADSVFKSKKDLLNTKEEVLVAENEELNNLKEDFNDLKISDDKVWTISPVVAVLNSNSFSTASPINKNLSNSTKGNNSYSYGVQVGYQLNRKWTIQTGVHVQEIQFSNNYIAVASTSSSPSSAVFNSGENYSLEDTSSKNFDSNSLSLSALSLDGNLAQTYGYIEIPVEVKYNILESKKLKTKIVAGFSSLFLNKNSIHLNSSSFSSTGKATNLNNINFSGNLGLDFNFNFDKNWSLNLNPMFKTQLNTFNENANGFKPYFIGVYTGINYQF